MLQRALLTMALSVTSAVVCAQELPKEISGRWHWPARNVGQSFSLENLQRTDASSFSASLTWWTMDSKCTIRSAPITGRVTEAGLSFDAATKCGAPFTAELNRSADGWQGTATTQGANTVVVELTAK